MADPVPLGWDTKPPDAKPYQIAGYTEPADGDQLASGRCSVAANAQPGHHWWLTAM